MINYELTDKVLKLKSDDGVQIDFYYDENEISYVHLDGNEFKWDADVLSGLYVRIEGKLTSVNIARRAAQEIIYLAEDDKRMEQDDGYDRHMRAETRQGKFV